MSLRYLSVCSGIEAASVAWEPLGWRAAGFAEIDKAASRVLAHRWPAVPNHRDFTTIDARRIGRVDLLVGGTPCQAFSVAGRRGSLADARGNLSLAFTELAHDLARHAGCRWAVWENVPGVLSLPDNAFGCFLAGLVGADDPVVPPDAKGWGPHPCFDEGSYDVHRTYRFESCRWPGQGMVSGPWARAAWRVLDAQWFGLAQRRERVFVVVGFGDETDPAAVLFERQGLRRHPPPRGEAGQGVARPLAAGSPSGSGYRNDADTADTLIAACLDASFGRLQGCSGQDANHGHSHLVPACLNGLSEYGGDVPTLRAAGVDVGGGSEALLAFGGNDTRGPIEVATALNAHGGPCGRQDFESETFIAHTLRGEGFDASEDGTGRGTPIVPVVVPILSDRTRSAEPVPILESGKRTGSSSTTLRAGDGIGRAGDPMFTLGADSRHAIAFDTTQITSATNRCNPQLGDPCHPLAAGAHPPSLAFAPPTAATLTRGADSSGAGGPAGRRQEDDSNIVAFQARGTNLDLGQDVTGTLTSGSDRASAGAPCVASAWAVRRLTPTECERLQGFPDGHTAIPVNAKGDIAADGARYKQLGNSMAVPVMRWIGERIAKADAALVEAAE